MSEEKAISQSVDRLSLKHAGGRPRIYESAEELAEAVDGYFEYCKGEYHIEKVPQKKKGKRGGDEDGEIEIVEVKVWDRYPEQHTVTGLTLFLGFAHRQSLDDYEKRPEFSDIIKWARSRVEHGYEKCLFKDRPTGAIFALTNMGWKNQQNLDHTSGGKPLEPTVIKWGDKEIKV